MEGVKATLMVVGMVLAFLFWGIWIFAWATGSATPESNAFGVAAVLLALGVEVNLKKWQSVQ